MKSLIFDTLTFTAIAAILVAIIRGVSLIKKPKIEKLVLADEQKIILHIFQFIMLTLICTVFSLNFLELYTGDKISNYKDDSNTLLQIIINGLILGGLVAYFIYIVYAIAIMNAKKYYINHTKYGQLYILKSVDSDRILLSNVDYETEERFQLILKKDVVFEHKIIRENKKKVGIKRKKKQ